MLLSEVVQESKNQDIGFIRKFYRKQTMEYLFNQLLISDESTRAQFHKNITW